MGVLKVNVGTAAVPDWRKVGCGAPSGAEGVIVLTGTDSYGDDWVLTLMSGAQAASEGTADPTGFNDINGSVPWGFSLSAEGEWISGSLWRFTVYNAAGQQLTAFNSASWPPKAPYGPYYADIDFSDGTYPAPPTRVVLEYPVGNVLIDESGVDWPTEWAVATGRLKLHDGTQWLKEACDGGAPTITDTFTRADSTTSLGSPWTLAGSGAWGISSNRGYKVSGFGIPYVTAGYGDQDVTVTMYRSATTGSSRIYLRANFSADFYYVVELTGAAGMTVTRASGTAFVAMTAVSGVGTPFATWTGTETVWRATIIGGTINVYCDGVLAARYVDSVPLPSTNTQVGIESTENGPTAAYFDDFSVGEATTVVGHPLKVNIGTADAPDWVVAACMTPA